MSENENQDNQLQPQESADIHLNLADIGVIFHEHASALMVLLQAINPIMEYMGPNPFDGKGQPSIEELNQLLEKPVRALTDSLDALLKPLSAEWNKMGITEECWNELAKQLDQLSNYKARIRHMAFRPPFLRQSARTIVTLVNKVRKIPDREKQINKIVGISKKIDKLICLYDLSQAKSRIISMDQQTRTLRDFLTANVRQKESRQILRVNQLIKEIVGNLEAFSKERRVGLKLQNGVPNVYVKVAERDVVRALSNILHNSIKYSWQMQGEETAWVTIRCYTKRDYIYFDFENWGVPIKKEEIDQGLIFLMGYRGALAGDGGRSGTGIGLHDAWKTAKEHGGDIIVRSNPARDAKALNIYKQPFITRVSLKLPIFLEVTDGD
jgi:signal transduction histidine kinase